MTFVERNLGQRKLVLTLAVLLAGLGVVSWLTMIRQEDPRLPDYFGLLPKADLVVKRVEPFREQDGAAQHYMPSTPDGSRPGIYYIHLSDMTAMPKPQLEVIAYHEGNPGHHMQNSIARELENTPTFRTQANFSAYGEGWGLYSELLAREMGAYDDPYSDFGRLSSEMWRALRLVVDTGLHSKGWTEQDAIDFIVQNSPEPMESVISEVRRYIVWPGQALAYKIGELKIKELRAYATEALGDQFDTGRARLALPDARGQPCAAEHARPRPPGGGRAGAGRPARDERHHPQFDARRRGRHRRRGLSPGRLDQFAFAVRRRCHRCRPCHRSVAPGGEEQVPGW